jgi:hypothetical protein
MKQHWTSRDLGLMILHPLALAPDDIGFIQNGLRRRRATAAVSYTEAAHPH